MNESTNVYVDFDGIVKEVGTDAVVHCSWTVACERPANDVRPHPILGGVPICTQHLTWVESL